jgi:adenine-specific DNA-methyltransferase
MPIRYMGTKRSIALPVRDIILREGAPNLPVVDLFSGIGAVSCSFADARPIIANDVLNFIYPLSASRLTASNRAMSPSTLVGLLEAEYLSQKAYLTKKLANVLDAEQEVLDGQYSLSAYMESSQQWYLANWKRPARRGDKHGRSFYSLLTRYFSGSYFSFRQTIDLDAVRFAIDGLDDQELTDWAIAAWLSTMSAIVNSPGHTAQYLKPSTDEVSRRILRTWRRNAWRVFTHKLSDIIPLGSSQWRSGNEVRTSSASTALEQIRPGDCGAIYADPPYTRDDYSRFYHLYETAYLYDFPEVAGSGRTRTERVTSTFCGRRTVIHGFQEIKKETQRIGCSLILSYPEDGLLCRVGSSVREMFEGVSSFEAHAVPDVRSRLGANGTRQWRRSLDCIYVIRP